MYLINHDKSEYIDLSEYIRGSSRTWQGGTWCINPLPLLTACGNGRGGGDFGCEYEGYEYIGAWAFNTVEYTALVPEGYAQQSHIFIEERRS